MKGKHVISITSRKATYRLELERKISVLKGNSGTGKSSLIRLISEYLEYGKQSGVKLLTDPVVSLSVLTNTSDWSEILASVHDTVLFIDEDVRYLYSESFQRELWAADCYAVIVSRSGRFAALPYSISGIYELVTEKRGINTATTMYRLYEEERDRGYFDLVLTEDSNSGFEWFSFLADKAGIHCISSGGKSSVFTSLLQHKGGKILVFADGAAFGAEMERVYQYTQLHPETTMLYLPESFEWLILRSGILHDEEIRTVLASPSDYIDSRLYFSWEQFFSAYLTEKSKDTVYQYSKTKLNSVLTHEHCIAKMLQVIENG